MKLQDLTGKVFGRLTVLSRAENLGRRTMWRCLCSCGNETVTNAYKLKCGETTSCGCYHREVASRVYSTLAKTHGKTHTPEHVSWAQMKARCTNPKHHAWKYYGGRGVSVCREWLDNFEQFLKDMGPRPAGTSLDRIDVDGDYTPGNCRWADAKTQRNNQQRSPLRVAYG